MTEGPQPDQLPEPLINLYVDFCADIEPAPDHKKEGAENGSKTDL